MTDKYKLLQRTLPLEKFDSTFRLCLVRFAVFSFNKLSEDERRDRNSSRKSSPRSHLVFSEKFSPVEQRKVFIEQARHLMVVLWTLSVLILTVTFVSPTVDHIQFKLWQRGSQYVPSNSSALLANVSGISSRLRCAITCLNNIHCRVINFDSSTQQCSLFSSWLFQGNSTSSPSLTSQIGYVRREAIYYTSYLQPCTTASVDPISRYMQCAGGVWTCPDQFFFSGYICERPRSINMTCLTSNWCDASKYLVCSTVTGLCQCNATMQWNGSLCVPSQ